MNLFTQVEEIRASDLTPKEIELVGSGAGARFVRFKHAILARAEVNKNRDRITPEGIQELAATLPLTAIDDEHKKTVVVGYFTDARVVDEKGVPSLDTDGLLYADRFPQQTQEVLNGSRFLSVEAGADKAECSICHASFTTEDEYCAHLNQRLMDKQAERVLYGLQAKGGATTRRPAGTDTRFDLNHVELLASLASDAPPKGMAYRIWKKDPALYAKIRKTQLVDQTDGARYAAQRLMAAMAGDKIVPFPGQVVYRPVYSPWMYVQDPEWVSRIANAGPAQPAKAMEATEKEETPKESLEKHLEGRTAGGTVVGFSLDDDKHTAGPVNHKTFWSP